MGTRENNWYANWRMMVVRFTNGRTIEFLNDLGEGTFVMWPQMGHRYYAGRKMQEIYAEWVDAWRAAGLDWTQAWGGWKYGEPDPKLIKVRFSGEHEAEVHEVVVGLVAYDRKMEPGEPPEDSWMQRWYLQLDTALPDNVPWELFRDALLDELSYPEVGGLRVFSSFGAGQQFATASVHVKGDRVIVKNHFALDV